MLPKAAQAGQFIGVAFSVSDMRKERGTTMRVFLLIMLGAGLALVGLQTVQAQVTIDATKITCEQFLASEVTDLENPSASG